MRPWAEMPAAALARVRVLAADIDDTITGGGKITGGILDTFERLAANGITVALVTGRSAGWAHALANYLPGVRFVVGENGLVMFEGRGQGEGEVRRRDLGREVRAAVPDGVIRASAHELRRRFGLVPTGDDDFRLFERTLERPAAFDAAALAACEAAVDPRCEVIASSIHIHVRGRGWGKAEGLRASLGEIGVSAGNGEILFVGDSANDRSLFRAFPETSVGVRNVEKFLGELGTDVPKYITRQEAAAGFGEVAQRLLSVAG